MTATLVLPQPQARSVRHYPRLVRPALAAPRLSAVIVNYCQWKETASLVRQLRSAAAMGQGDVEIMVVDNRSPPHPSMRKLRRWSGVSLRRWGRNRGYARAVNEGCRLSQGRWLLVLNPDVTLNEGFVEGVLALAEQLGAEDSRAGIVGFQLRNSDGSCQLSAGVFPTLWGTLAGLCRPRSRRKYQHISGPERVQVPWVTGCCLLIRRECLEDLGGFDEDFFLYYEDVDFCRRAQARGWTVWYEPALGAIHHRPLHGRSVPSPLRLCTRHALLTYAAKHWGAVQLEILTAIVRMEAWIRQRLARCVAESETFQHWQALDALAADVRAGRLSAARRRVDRVMGRRTLTTSAA